MVDDLIEVANGIELRPIVAADRDFLLTLYASTRADELSAVPWTEAERASFVTMQFDTQDMAYRQTYPDGRFLLVLAAGQPIGRLYVARVDDEIHLIEMALVPAARGQGTGSALLAWVLAAADRDGLAVTLHVEPGNPARRLYERFGFVTVEERGIHAFMRRPPTRQLKTAS